MRAAKSNSKNILETYQHTFQLASPKELREEMGGDASETDSDAVFSRATKSPARPATADTDEIFYSARKCDDPTFLLISNLLGDSSSLKPRR